jgi:hypothetical protein
MNGPVPRQLRRKVDAKDRITEKPGKRRAFWKAYLTLSTRRQVGRTEDQRVLRINHKDN